MSLLNTIAFCEVNFNYFLFLYFPAHAKKNHDDSFEDRQKSINRKEDGRLVTFLISMIVVSESHPKTKKYFHSTDAVYKEIIRHMFSNYWYIIHPYSKFRQVLNKLFFNGRDGEVGQLEYELKNSKFNKFFLKILKLSLISLPLNSPQVYLPRFLTRNSHVFTLK